MDRFIEYGIDILVLTIIYIKVFYKKWKYKGFDQLVVNTVMYLYIVSVLYVTLMPIIVSIPDIYTMSHLQVNLIPFDDYFHGRGDTIRQILLNTIMMVPFGFLFPVVRRKSLIACLLSTLLFSLTIEVLQPLFLRSADITDLITNTFGGFLGYVMYLLFQPLVNKIVDSLKQFNYLLER